VVLSALVCHTVRARTPIGLTIGLDTTLLGQTAASCAPPSGRSGRPNVAGILHHSRPLVPNPQTSPPPVHAIIANVEGVLTRTRALNELAWKVVLDDWLERYDGQLPFSGQDFYAHFEARPQPIGLAGFLESRGLELTYGEANDKPHQLTVNGLSNRQANVFSRLVDEQGVDVFEDAFEMLRRWRKLGLRVAAISFGRHSLEVLRVGGIHGRLDAVVDADVAAKLSLAQKVDLMKLASQLMDVKPDQTAVLEDSGIGVVQALKGGFGVVVGVAKNGNQEQLREAGADLVVDVLYDLEGYLKPGRRDGSTGRAPAGSRRGTTQPRP
jgi:beta-phosphoglucomutase-like phosphatase (HAD superfamily)